MQLVSQLEKKQPFLQRYRAFPLYMLICIEVFNATSLLTNPNPKWWNYINIFTIPIVVPIGLWFVAGSPRHWWRLYFGTCVELGSSLRVAEYKTAKDVDKAIDHWIHESGVKTYYRHGSYYYQFLRKKDAVLFKTAWA